MVARATGDVGPDGSWTIDGDNGETKNLKGYFAKSHRMRSEMYCAEWRRISWFGFRYNRRLTEQRFT